jgi:chemotaxis protein MotB
LTKKRHLRTVVARVCVAPPIKEDAVLAIRSKWLLAAGLASFMAVGCGHSDEEMSAKQREIDKLSADLKAAKDQLTADQAKFTEAQSQIDAMKAQLQDFAKTKEDAANLMKALKDYKERADRLAVIEARFRELRTKLDKLNSIGLKVVVRNNRMVIQLPGDILFDSGKDALKPQGKEALAQVAEIIRGDKDLASRYFVVAGHTDNAKYGGGPFHDNWGLSLARSRQVLLFMVNPVGKKPGEGGGLEASRWSAAGYGETDPQEGTVAAQSKEQMQKNRRVELVVQPNVEEMLQLNSIR